MTSVKTLDDPFGLNMVTEHFAVTVPAALVLSIDISMTMDTAKPVPSDKMPWSLEVAYPMIRCILVSNTMNG